MTAIKPPSIVRLSAQQVADRLAQPRESLILLDVRALQEWDEDGRIEGATLIPIEEIETRAEAELPRDAEIIAYCHLGVRSLAVANWLARLGFNNVSDLEGGIDAWTRAGLPVEFG